MCLPPSPYTTFLIHSSLFTPFYSWVERPRDRTVQALPALPRPRREARQQQPHPVLARNLSGPINAAVRAAAASTSWARGTEQIDITAAFSWGCLCLLAPLTLLRSHLPRLLRSVRPLVVVFLAGRASGASASFASYPYPRAPRVTSHRVRVLTRQAHPCNRIACCVRAENARCAAPECMECSADRALSPCRRLPSQAARNAGSTLNDGTCGTFLR